MLALGLHIALHYRSERYQWRTSSAFVDVEARRFMRYHYSDPELQSFEGLHVCV